MDIKRYDVGGDHGYGYCDEEEQGDWVLFDDHCAVVDSLQSALTKALELNNDLQIAADKRIEWAHEAVARIDFLEGEVEQAQELLTDIYAQRILSIYDDARIERWLAHQCAPAAKNLTNQSPNQCDGCQAGIPIEVNQYGTPLHRMGCEGGYSDYMACTAKLYLKEKAPLGAFSFQISLKISQYPLDSPFWMAYS